MAATKRRAAARPPGRLRLLLWDVPLGWQLAALYTLILAITLGVVGVAVYTQQQNFLVQDAAARLQDTAARVVDRQGPGAVPDGGHTLPDNHGLPGDGLPPGDGGTATDTSPAALLESLVRGLSGPDVTVAVLDLQGTVITSTQALAGANAPSVAGVSAAQIAAAQAGPSTHWIAGDPAGGREVVVLQPFVWRPPSFTRQPDQTLLIEQTQSLAAVDAALSRLGTYLLLGALFGTLAGLVLGLAFTRAVLQPLDRVTGTAEAIAAGDLDRRLRLPPGRNEVARLGHTFDHMVGRLVAALEAQRRFVADASHELRTPLTSLKGLAEILMIGAHGNDTRVIESSARAIHEELDRLSRLVNDLLLLSRLEATERPAVPAARPAPMDVCATVEAAAAQMSALAQARGVGLVTECAAPLPLVGDAGQLKQVLLNLLDNALRYTPAGGTVTVRGAAARRAGRDHGGRHGAGHPRARPAPHLRALLPRRLLALAGDREQRPRPGHRARHRRGARRPDHRRLAPGGWHHLHHPPAAGARAGRCRGPAARARRRGPTAPGRGHAGGRGLTRGRSGAGRTTPGPRGDARRSRPARSSRARRSPGTPPGYGAARAPGSADRPGPARSRCPRR